MWADLTTASRKALEYVSPHLNMECNLKAQTQPQMVHVCCITIADE